VVVARTVSGAALSVPHATKIGALGTRPMRDRNAAAYLEAQIRENEDKQLECIRTVHLHCL
jgi:hypothetical protein